MFAKTNYVGRMLFVKPLIMLANVCADLDTTEIHWMVVLVVGHYQCRVDYHPIVLQIHTVTIKFANLLATMTWNVVLMKSVITANA